MYTLSASVTGTSDYGALTGTVSFLDASNGNAVPPPSPGASGANTGRIGRNLITKFYPAGRIAGYEHRRTSMGTGFRIWRSWTPRATPYPYFWATGDAGTFPPADRDPELPRVPESMVTGDFNGDGIPDLAYLSINLSTLRSTEFEKAILLGNGDGTFTAEAPHTSCRSHSQLLLEKRPISVDADFNQDGSAWISPSA